MTAWTTYGELARHLDEANPADAERVARRREAVHPISAAWALAGMLAQWTMILRASDQGGSDLFPVVAGALCGLPAIAFFGRSVTTGLIGKPRLDEPPDKHATRTQATTTPRNPRLGA